MERDTRSPVILAAQRRTTEALLAAQLRARKINPADYKKRMAELQKGEPDARA